MQRFWFEGNPQCARADCGHALRGDRKTGHFNLGAGPCKSQACQCMAFVKSEMVVLHAIAPGPRVGAKDKVAPMVREPRRSVRVR